MRMARSESALRVSFYSLILEKFVADKILDIIMVKEVQTNHNFGERPYYGFEHVTMVRDTTLHV